jgi:histidinol phosphatase-like PHP family hydrolase
MSDDTQAQAAADQQQGQQVDPQFFTVVNQYLELTNRQSKDHGLKRISMASLYAAARFNAHVYLSNVGANAAAERQQFLDYMTRLYRQMLNEHLDGLGHERGINVGESELKAEIEAMQKLQEAQQEGDQDKSA